MKTIKKISLFTAAVMTLLMLLTSCNNQQDNKPINTSDTLGGAGQEGSGYTDITEEQGNGENNTGYTSASGIMRDITAADLVKEMTFGWNLGDTLDVCQADRDGDGKINEHAEEGEEVDETLWGNVMTTPELFKHLKDDGFNAVRIPVTWRDHLDDNDNIKESWMNRVQEVVDYAINQGFYVIINMHHDGGGDPQFGAWIQEWAAEDYDKFYARYSKMWNQIADRFRDYGDYLIFESMNEVGFEKLSTKPQRYEMLNRVNQDFVNIIRGSGGNNEKRHLLIAGYWTDVAETCNSNFKMPEDTIADRLIVSVHYYTPSEFCIFGSQKTWGTESDIKLMTNKMNKMKTTFVDNGVPFIIGEYAAGGSSTEQVFFCEYLNKLCHDMGAACFLWDNGGYYNRTAFKWNVSGLPEGLKRAVSGEDYEIEKTLSISAY